MLAASALGFARFYAYNNLLLLRSLISWTECYTVSFACYYYYCEWAWSETSETISDSAECSIMQDYQYDLSQDGQGYCGDLRWISLILFFQREHL